MSKERIILMYHGIVNGQDAVPPGREVGADLYDVTESNFRDQLSMLREKNIKVKRIEEAGAVDVVITFDDGEANNCRTALPVLKEFGYPAYFFVITRRVGRPGYMTMDELKTMVANGMVIGSHGMSHEILTNLKDTQIEEELAASRRYLERNLETEIRDFSIPRGFCNDKILRMAYAAGYKNVFISDRPRDLSDDKCHERVAVKQNWDLARFELAIKGEVPVKEAFMDRTKNLTKLVLREGGYNWLRQLFIKIMK